MEDCMVTRLQSTCVGVLIFVVFLVPLPSHATIMYNVSFNDPGGTFLPF